MAQPAVVALTVKDIPASLKFYRLLGMDIPQSDESEDHVDCATPAGIRMAWDTVKLMQNIYGKWVEPAGQRISLAFKCADAAEVDALYKKVIQAGYKGEKEPWDAFWGQRYAVVIDPDGNHVDLFA